jgi:hypothetical protein
MSENHFDQGCRYQMINLDSKGILAWLLQLAPEAFGFHGWLDTRSIPFPGQPDRTCDTVGYLTDEKANGVPWAVPFEFQTDPDPEMPGRLLEYLGRIWREKKPDPHRGSRFSLGAVVVNLTEKGAASLDSFWPEAGLHTQLLVHEVNLAGLDADSVLTGIEQGATTRSLLPWIPLMQKGDDPGIISRWVAVALTEPSARWRAEYGALAVVFAEAANCRDVWKQALKGWQMTESMQVREWQQEARTEALAEGEAKGEAIGEAKGRAAAVVKVLEARFTSVPKDLADAIRATTGLDTLDRWLPLAVQADSLDAFRQAAGV